MANRIFDFTAPLEKLEIHFMMAKARLEELYRAFNGGITDIRPLLPRQSAWHCTARHQPARQATKDTRSIKQHS